MALWELPARERRWILWAWVWLNKSTRATSASRGIKNLNVNANKKEIMILRAAAKGFRLPLTIDTLPAECNLLGQLINWHTVRRTIPVNRPGAFTRTDTKGHLMGGHLGNQIKITMLHYCYFALLLFCIIATLLYCIIALLLHCIITLLRYYSIVILWYHIITLLY